MSDKIPNIPPDTMRYLTIGIEFIAVFLVFFAMGFAVDRYWGKPPIFTAVGMVVGFAASMYRIIRVAREYERTQGRDQQHKGPPNEEGR